MKQLDRNEYAEHGFRINTPAFLKEVVDNALVPGGNNGVLKVPINVLVRYLISISERAAQINDPILNKIMCDMALYEVSDPYSEDYNPDIVNEVYRTAKQYRKENKT